MLPSIVCARAAPNTPASRATVDGAFPVALGGLRLETGDSALALHLSRLAQASHALRPIRSQPTRLVDLCPQGFDDAVARTIAQVAIKVYRHLLEPDLRRHR